jgi:primary-amine oxidase
VLVLKSSLYDNDIAIRIHHHIPLCKASHQRKIALQHASDAWFPYCTMPRAFPPVEQNDIVPKRRNAPKSKLPASVIESVAGFSAGIVSCLAAHPLDLLKNRLQLNTQTRSRPGDSFRILRNVVRDEGGARALYRGLWPNLLGNSLGWGLYFLFYGNLKELFQSRRKEGEHLGSAEFFSASIIAGTFGMLLWKTGS